MTLAEAVARAAELSDERALADLRRSVDDDLEASARSADYRERALAYRAIGQLRFNQKTELLRRGLEDASPAARGSALLSLELLSRTQPGLVNSSRPLLHTLANEDPNEAVRRLAVLSLKNGSPQSDTITLLAHLAEEAESTELRAAAAARSPRRSSARRRPARASLARAAAGAAAADDAAGGAAGLPALLQQVEPGGEPHHRHARPLKRAMTPRTFESKLSIGLSGSSLAARVRVRANSTCHVSRRSETWV